MNRRTFTTGALAAVAGLASLSNAGAATARQEDGEDEGGEDAGTRFLHEGEALTLDAAPDQVVRGRSSFGAGVTLTVRLRSSGETPFIKSAETTVGEDGRFAATFDLSDVEPGSSFTASVSWLSLEQATAEGTVQAVDPRVSLDYEGQTLTLSPAAEQTVTGSTALGEGATLTVRLLSNRGSPFIRSTEPTVGADGRFAATFDLSEVDPGTVALLEVHYRDSRRTFAVVEVVEETDG